MNTKHSKAEKTLQILHRISTLDPDTGSRLIDELGGTGAVAGLLGVSAPAVSQWRNYGIPKGRLLEIRLLRPGAFNATVMQ